MAKLDKESIQSLIQLCRIDCTEGEQDELRDNLQKILTYIEQLQELDTDHVQATNHVLEGMCNVTRDDSVGETMSREVFLSNAPSQIGGMVRVPPVMKSNNP